MYQELEKILFELNEKTPEYFFQEENVIQSLDKNLTIASNDRLSMNAKWILRMIAQPMNKSIGGIFELISDEAVFSCLSSHDFIVINSIIEQKGFERLKHKISVLRFLSFISKERYSWDEQIVEKNLDYVFVYFHAKAKRYSFLLDKFDATHVIDVIYKSLFEPFGNDEKPFKKYEKDISTFVFKKVDGLKGALKNNRNAIVLLKEKGINIFKNISFPETDARFIVQKLYDYNKFWKEKSFERFAPSIISKEKYTPIKHQKDIVSCLEEIFTIVVDFVEDPWINWFSELSFENKVLWLIHDDFIFQNTQFALLKSKEIETAEKLFSKITSQDGKIPTLETLHYYILLKAFQSFSSNERFTLLFWTIDLFKKEFKYESRKQNAEKNQR